MAANKTEFSTFIAIAFSLNVIECVLIGLNPYHTQNFVLSVVVLALAILVFVYGVIKVISYFPPFYPTDTEKHWYSIILLRLCIPKTVVALFVRVVLSFDREMVLELLAYSLGMC